MNNGYDFQKKALVLFFRKPSHLAERVEALNSP
jgi:hypothetical protein